MTSFVRLPASGLLLLVCAFLGGLAPAHPIAMKVSRDAIERTLKQQLFRGPDGRYYLKGNAQPACFPFVEAPNPTFAQDPIVVRVKTYARLGKAVGGTCPGLPLTVPAEV